LNFRKKIVYCKRTSLDEYNLFKFGLEKMVNFIIKKRI